MDVVYLNMYKNNVDNTIYLTQFTTYNTPVPLQNINNGCIKCAGQTQR